MSELQKGKILKLFIDNMIRLDKRIVETSIIKHLKSITTRKNPEYAKKYAMGMWIGNTPRNLVSWTDDENFFYIPRGTKQEIEKLVTNAEFVDQTNQGTDVEYKFNGKLRPYQVLAVSNLLTASTKNFGAMLRGPCGCGKTIMLISAICSIGKKAIVVVPSTSLADQWKTNIEKFVGCSTGQYHSGKFVLGDIMIVTQQSLWSSIKRGKDRSWIDSYGTVVIDEAHRTAANTYRAVAGLFSARHMIGATADERRKDGLEFLIYDTIGQLAHEIKPVDIADNRIPVRMEVIKTGYHDKGYTDGVLDQDGTGQFEYVDMINRLALDNDRMGLIVGHVINLLNE